MADKPLPMQFDYAKVPPSHQDNPSKPEYEYTSASLATKAHMWSRYHEEMATKKPKMENQYILHANNHYKNAKHLEAHAASPSLEAATSRPPKADTSWFSGPKPKEKDPEALPHPFRYGATAPPNMSTTQANDYLGRASHQQAQGWQEYHGKASDAAHDAGQMGSAAKHKALSELHGSNYEHLKPEECKYCQSEDHATAEHEVCSHCGQTDHSTDEHPCDYCGSSHHNTEDHVCESCNGEGHNSDSCDAEQCDHCGSYGHESDDCDKKPDEDEEDGDERVGWRGESRDKNAPVGPLGDQVVKQLEQHGRPQHYSHEDVPRGKYGKMDRAMTRKIDDGAVHTDDLYRSYKNTPHIAPSVLLKYIVHRVNHLQDYDDAGKAERLDKDFLALHQFGAAKEKNGQLRIGHLHHMLKNNPHLVDQLVAQRNAHQDAIKKGVGLNTRKINGEDYVALTRGLHSKTMSHEHALSSWADNHDIGFGSHKHHTWVPLKDIWHSYDLGSRYPKGNFGAEDEFLVSHNPKVNGHRYKATYADVTKNSFKGDEVHGPLGQMKGSTPANGSHHWRDVEPGSGIDAQKHAPKLMSSTDTDLAHHVEHHVENPERLFRTYGGVAQDILKHPNAGPETWAALMRQSFTHNNGDIPESWLTSKVMPANAALAHLARAGPSAAEGVLQNPNLSDEQVNHVLASATDPDEFIDFTTAVASRPNLSPKLAHEVLRKLDEHMQAHDSWSKRGSSVQDLAEKVGPEDRTKLLEELASRPIKTEGPEQPEFHEARNHWNLQMAKELLAQADPAEQAHFVEEMKPNIPEGDIGNSARRTWNSIVENAPPSDAEAHAYGEHGNTASTLLERTFTPSQTTHIMKHGAPAAIRALLGSLARRHIDSQPNASLPPSAQAALLERPDFMEHAGHFVEMGGLTPHSVGTFLEKLQSLPGKKHVELLKSLARNEHLGELTIKNALPPSAKEQLPFVFERQHGALTSAERKQVAAYKKANPDTKPIWTLLTTRLRQPGAPKGHIVKPLPASERFQGPLHKALPGFKFPGLGVPDDRRETPILESRSQVKLKDAQMAHAAIRQFPEAAEDIKWQHQTSSAAESLNGAPQVYGPTTNSYAKANGIRRGTTGAKSDLATKLHEDFHNTFKRVQATHGIEGRKNLARNLMANLKLHDPRAHDALHEFHATMYGGGRGGDPLSTEEHFTHLLNYLNDPVTREKFHRHVFGADSSMNRDVLKFNQAMKRAYKHLLRTALTADSKWTLKPSEKSKTDWNEAFPDDK